MIKKKMTLVALATLASMASLSYADTIVNEVMPGSHNNGAWIYDGTFDASGQEGPVQAGLFVKQLQQYNDSASSGSEFNQVFSYGGNLEMYCDGGEGGQDTNACVYNSLLLVYYPPSIHNKNYADATFRKFSPSLVTAVFQALINMPA